MIGALVAMNLASAEPARAPAQVRQTTTGPNSPNLKDIHGNVTIHYGITPEQYEAGLRRKEQALRQEFAQLTTSDTQRQGVLEKELAAVQGKLNNLQAAYEEQKARLAQAQRALDDFKRDFPPDEVVRAKEALAHNDTAGAEKLFTQALKTGSEKAAEAAHQLGELANNRIELERAYSYFQKAAELAPDNPEYLNKAAVISHTLGHYGVAEPLYERSLT
ncbi:MAG: hypothetical protein LC672_05475, partial [Acidobacteria bacterium]|nr:hypothetical protein [Acidobacteriota bacterium]